MIALTVVLAALVGISLGLLGGGGSILMVPLLTYVAGMDAKQAIATSLLVVGVTSTVSTVSHARAGRVQWRSGLLFGAAGMAGAYAGGRLGHLLPGSLLLIAFAVMMIASAVAMLRRRRTPVTPAPAPHRTPIGKALTLGAAVGLLTGIIGAGGGFIVVPTLALLAGLTMPVAVGTSLLVIAMNALAGLAGQVTTLSVDWKMAAIVTAAAVVGSLVGARLTARVDADVLRAAFGWFVLVMASVILAEQVHPVVGIAVAGLTVAAGGYRYACSRFTWCPLNRLWSRAAAAT
ncbi:sulfite exporter TauE/SafE family protein [Mycolicibacterium brisbanense]|uniref:Probable membrane transporter protein n=1 Tax=Mycolicibacterium brisbanense TaxID=146020 RepID=A0A100VUI5_9MYCO|nr:sulfite exporter TauE/SafE family protein [Mycolicibacterium brisbanense]MCV7157046.1 sulfite exporter TauE/SafE family protein [Mycolicibacterium brisbanense]GAS86126.1 membrane protein [Mycolicibacterium brisbanense]